MIASSAIQCGVSTIDSTGFEEFYGPFELDTDYGAEVNIEPVDWTATRTAFEHNMRAHGFVKKNQRWRRVSEKAAQKLVSKKFSERAPVINLEFEASGIHAISGQQVLDILPNWRGAALGKLALILNGKPVARDIISDDQSLSGDDYIVINARKAEGTDAVYLKNYVYQLRLDRSGALAASHFGGSASSRSTSRQSTAMVAVEATADKVYSAGLHADEPWYDRRLVSRGQPASAS
ncbi:MAG: hypothetical protein ACJAQ6_000534 [Arenicella sp.]